MTKDAKTHTPVMQQYLGAKEQYPDALLFFRLGDFYEMFYDDAVRCAELLDLALTSRGSGPDGEPIPMAGVPHHAAAGYVARLLKLGKRLAVSEVSLRSDGEEDLVAHVTGTYSIPPRG